MVSADSHWMQLALKEAKKADKKGEVPVGAVAVYKGKKIASAHNLSISCSDPTAHAEILCLRKAAKQLKNYRLAGIILYVTVEPCAMCAGAMVWARIKKLVFGCKDKKAGACGSVLNLSNHKKFNHRFEVTGGILEEDCRQLLQTFFEKRR